MDLKNINTVGVIMFGLLGDALMRTPVLRALKEIYPNCRVIAICDTMAASILKNDTSVDEIIKMDKKYILSKIIATYKVRALKCDLLIDLYNGGSSSNITLLSAAKYRLGYKEQKKSSYYNILSEGIKNKTKKIYSYNEQIISILAPLSNKKFNVKPIFQITQQTKNSVMSSLENLYPNTKNLYTLNLGSGGSEKILDFDMYNHIVVDIYNRYGYIPAIVANPGQEYLQEKLIEDYLLPNSIPYVKLKGMSLEEIGALMSLTRFVVTPDTGLLHIAISCESFILGLFTYTHPDLVNFGYEKLVCVYENFDDDKLWQNQNIDTLLLSKGINALMEKGNFEKICNDI